MIEIQQPPRHFANVRQRLDPRFVPREMLLPAVRSRIVEPGQHSRTRAHGAKIGALMPIAVETGPCEVLRHRQPAMLYTDDVVDFTAVVNVLLVDQTILAYVVRAVRHHLAEGVANFTAHARATGGRAPWPGSLATPGLHSGPVRAAPPASDPWFSPVGPTRPRALSPHPRPS